MSLQGTGGFGGTPDGAGEVRLGCGPEEGGMRTFKIMGYGKPVILVAVLVGCPH